MRLPCKDITKVPYNRLFEEFILRRYQYGGLERLDSLVEIFAEEFARRDIPFESGGG